MTDLATRIEQAGEGCRELDQDIFCDLGLAPFVDGAFNAYHAPAYSTSIDAALTLVPEEFTNKWTLGWAVDGVPFASVPWGNLIRAATPALALCAAAIRARGL